jgi:hypothetical protein
MLMSGYRLSGVGGEPRQSGGELVTLLPVIESLYEQLRTERVPDPDRYGHAAPTPRHSGPLAFKGDLEG